ncbi:MAG: hypothetical protein PHE53_05110 [Thermoguttaceae bacterium]|nr:hypothetical protein [Thermoguttaceae bacterium]
MISRRQFLTGMTTGACAYMTLVPPFGSWFVSASVSGFAESPDWPRPVIMREPLETASRPSTKMRQISTQMAAAQGVRRLESQHLLLWTDLPESDSVDTLPDLFDLAVPQYAQWFGVEWTQAKSWKPVACLMRNRSLFSQLQLLPSDLPNFSDGYSVYDAFWCAAQKTAYYQRTLLFHEGVHGFMVDFCGGCGAPWFMEGWAEFLATHRLTLAKSIPVEAMHDDSNGGLYTISERSETSANGPNNVDMNHTLELGVLPSSPFDVSGAPPTSTAPTVESKASVTSTDTNTLEPLGWGRIRTLQGLVKRNRRKTLLEVMQISAANFDPREAYAWSWAAAYLLAHDPLSRDIFLAMCGEVQRPDFTVEFLRRLGDDTIRKLEAEWFVFLSELEYGLDYERSRIDFSTCDTACTPLSSRWTKQSVSAGRGWISTGLTVQKGDTFQLASRGRVMLCVPNRESGLSSSVESEPNGISIHYHGGQPRGKLLLTVATMETPERFVQPFAVGATATLTSPVDGVIFVRVNDSSAFLAENQGNFEVAIRRQMTYTEPIQSEKLE